MDWTDTEGREHPVSGVILRFPPIRERQMQDELSHEAVLRRVRFAAKFKGCNPVQEARVEAAARVNLAKGMKAHDVILAAESMAKALRCPDGPDEAA